MQGGKGGKGPAGPDPLSRLYSFPANSQFWAELVRQAKGHPGAMRAPHFHVDCPNMREGMLLNKYFLRSFVVGWERNNGHVVKKSDANTRDSTNHESAEFWGGERRPAQGGAGAEWDGWEGWDESQDWDPSGGGYWQQPQQQPTAPHHLSQNPPGAVPDSFATASPMGARALHSTSWQGPASAQQPSQITQHRSFDPPHPQQQYTVGVRPAAAQHQPPAPHSHGGGTCPTCRQHVGGGVSQVSFAPHASSSPAPVAPPAQPGVPYISVRQAEADASVDQMFMVSQGGGGGGGVSMHSFAPQGGGGGGGGGGRSTSAARSMGGPSNLSLEEKLRNAQIRQRDWQGSRNDWTGQGSRPENASAPRPVQYGVTVAHDIPLSMSSRR